MRPASRAGKRGAPRNREAETEMTDRTLHLGPAARAKADRVHAVLQRHITVAGCDLLDVGTGTGETAAALQARGAKVIAIDRQDRDLTVSGLDVHLVQGTALPFDGDRFDAVLYTHVIEHVGTVDDQCRHLSEIRRVLRPEGVLYLAVPNRWSPVEPHYKLPLLSWFPNRIASAYLRATGRGENFDCLPHSRRSLVRLFERTGFRGEEVTGTILEGVLRERIRNPALLRLALFFARRRWLSMPLIPVLVFVARPVSS